MTVCKSPARRGPAGELSPRGLPVALRQPPESPPDDTSMPAPGTVPDAETVTVTTEAPPGEGPLCCGQCLLPVALVRDRIRVNGSHRHVFANPHGLLFEIGCFARAPGCVPIGPATPDFSWFPGTTWRVAVCARCGLHLGWLYADQAGSAGFFGLILPRLRQAPPGGAPDGPAA